jgi:hypothetical protein
MSSTVLGTTMTNAPVGQEFVAYLSDWSVAIVLMAAGGAAVAIRRSRTARP